MAQFSFLMVISSNPGRGIARPSEGSEGEETLGGIDAFPMIVGFVAAFISGCLACKWMINIVKKGKLVYFGIYCAIAGAVTIICSLDTIRPLFSRGKA